MISRRLPHLEASTRIILKDLNVEYVDLETATCCPDPIFNRLLDPYDMLTISGFNLARAQQKKIDVIITPCNGCYHSLSSAVKQLEDEDTFSKINQRLATWGVKYEKKIIVTHLVDVLLNKVQDIKRRVKKPLEGMKVASHHGCHIFTEERMRTFKNLVNPTLIDRIVKALGATPIDYPHKTTCCGGNLRGYSESLILDIVQKKLLSAREFGAECITTLCPLCFLYLEGQQLLINRRKNININFPIFALSELIALAFGHTIKEIGLECHMVPPNLI
jgi:heterodisulfide reductase subunit B